MDETDVERTRAANIWETFARKTPPIARASRFEAHPQVDFDRIGGLADAKDEILTYACAATDPAVYRRWGTVPPTGLLMIGPPESGKTMLAEALALRTSTPFLSLRVPRLVVQTLHSGANAGALLNGWGEAFSELPRITVFFRELDPARIQALVSERGNVPVQPVLDFVLELIDRTVAADGMLVVGSTSHPENISPEFLEPGRFERIVSVLPSVPDDVVEALKIHAATAEKSAGRTLFEQVDWAKAVKRDAASSIADWSRLLHAILRRKARCDAADEGPTPVTTEDVLTEIERSLKTQTRLPAKTGTYL